MKAAIKMDNSEAIRSIENIVAVAVSDIKKPYPSNIIDLIFGKIESNDNLLKDYELLIATSRHSREVCGFSGLM